MCPELRPSECFDAVKKRLLRFDADRQFRRYAVRRRGGQQFRISRDTCTAVDAQSEVTAGDDEHQSDMRIHEKILYAIQTIVPISFGNYEPFLVQHLHKTRRITFRRDVA